VLLVGVMLFRQAARVLSKNAGFSAVACLTIAVAIGANTAVFSVFNAALLRPLPFPDASQIVTLSEKRTNEHICCLTVSAPDFLDWRRMAHSFASMGLYDTARFSLTGSGDPENVPGALVTAGFLESLGARPQLGRTFAVSEEQPANHRVAIITDGLWRRRFGSDPAIIGKSAGINGELFSIIGVLPVDFRFPFALRCDLLAPIVFTEDQLKYRGIHPFFGVARLGPGVRPEQAQAEMDLISKQLESDHPDTNTGHVGSLTVLRDQLAGKLRPALLVLLGAVFLVALIACANVANLLLARATVRRKEFAVRAAMGANRRQLACQSLAESAILAAVGSAGGILIALWGLDALRAGFFARIESFSLAGLDRVNLDWRVLLFTLVATIACTLLFGGAPALAGARVDLNDALRTSGRGATASDHGRLRSVLIVAEVALSLVLLTGAGLLGRSFETLLNVSPGFEPSSLSIAGLTLSSNQYRTTGQAAAFYDALLERIRALPGVRSAAITDIVPLTGDDNRTGVRIEGRTPRPDERWRMNPRLVSTRYLETMGVALVEGRTFSAQDAMGARPVAIVSEAAARQYWPGHSAVGQRFGFTMAGAPWIEVIGVVQSVHNRALDLESTPDVYLPYRENPFRYAPVSMSLVVRSSSGSSLAGTVRAAVSSLDSSLPVSSFQPMEYFVDASLAPRKFNLVLFGIFAALAIALAAAGLYGTMSYLVNQRSHEIGIRMALGAEERKVLRMVIGNGLAQAAIGVAIGLAVSFASARVMEGLLFGVHAKDPLVFSTVPAVLIAVTLLATYLPARRAARVDPLDALRIE
jgi:putative ABC transport system permease protein